MIIKTNFVVKEWICHGRECVSVKVFRILTTIAKLIQMEPFVFHRKKPKLEKLSFDLYFKEVYFYLGLHVIHIDAVLEELHKFYINNFFSIGVTDEWSDLFQSLKQYTPL